MPLDKAPVGIACLKYKGDTSNVHGAQWCYVTISQLLLRRC